MNPTSVTVRREILVQAPRARAFTTFVDMTAWWPLATHTLGKAPAQKSVVEPHVGGRWYGSTPTATSTASGTCSRTNRRRASSSAGK